MTAIDIASRPLPETDPRVRLRRPVIASAVGTTIEWYDFLLYSVVTGLVFGKLFFPKSEPLVGVLQAFAVYAVGFLARPMGAAISFDETLSAALRAINMTSSLVGRVGRDQTKRPKRPWRFKDAGAETKSR